MLVGVMSQARRNIRCASPVIAGFRIYKIVLIWLRDIAAWHFSDYASKGQ